MKQRTQNAKALWYQQNKEYLRRKRIHNYKNDPEYKQQIADKNRRAYDKTMVLQKQKRGRKPLDKPPIIDIEKNQEADQNATLTRFKTRSNSYILYI